MKVLGIIPARGGSKGVPRKNARLLCGRPLLAYTVDAALAATRLTRTILSSEDPQILEMGMELGVDVPFIRPAELATDVASSFDVVLHAVEELEKRQEFYDAVCLLQPTTPLRGDLEIDACIELLEELGADSVFTVVRVPDECNPNWVYLSSEDGRMSLACGGRAPIGRRQDLPAAFHRAGSVYVTRREVLREYGNLYGRHIRGYEIEKSKAVNIDTEEDWIYAEKLVSERSKAFAESAGHR